MVGSQVWLQKITPFIVLYKFTCNPAIVDVDLIYERLVSMKLSENQTDLGHCIAQNIMIMDFCKFIRFENEVGTI